MTINVKECLTEYADSLNLCADQMQFPDIRLDADTVKTIMISEVPPADPNEYFYSAGDDPDYMKTTLGLFRDAGVNMGGIGDIVGRGIYITTAVKTPKSGYTVDDAALRTHLPILEKELSLFPNLKVVMLMGDVAKKAFNMIARKNTNKACIPSGSTCKIRSEAFYYGDLRVFPSYIMTGGNILIEKSKCRMIAEDIRRMMELI